MEYALCQVKNGILWALPYNTPRVSEEARVLFQSRVSEILKDPRGFFDVKGRSHKQQQKRKKNMCFRVSEITPC